MEPTPLTKIRLGRPIIRLTDRDGTVREHLCPEQPCPVDPPRRDPVKQAVALGLALLLAVALTWAFGALVGASAGFLMADSVVPISFKKALFTGRAWKIALYVGAANLSNATAGYTAANEVVGAGYVAGGKNLVATILDGSDGVTALLDFDDIDWPAASFTARYLFIYDNNAANKEGFVVDMGQDQQISGGTFQVVWPDPDLLTAIMVAA